MSNLDASTYLTGPEDHLPPPVDEPKELKLVKPSNVKSRFWLHFMRYDQESHPEKKTTARCSLCGKDISVKQGTGGLKNHMKFKHPQENALLLDPNEDASQGTNQSSVAKTEAIGTPSRGGTATIVPSRKKPRLHENPYFDAGMRLETEKRQAEKHLMEMWSLTRKEIRDLRKDLKEEEDENVIRELESDIRVLIKKKADYADMLGFPKDDMTTEEV